MQVLFSIVMALVTLGILVTIHEYGHYWVARRCGVRVLRFAVGFGRPLAMRAVSYTHLTLPTIFRV